MGKKGHKPKNAKWKPSRIYQCYMDMKSRCYCKTHKSYDRYGGRGIKVCDEWLDDFDAFYEWAISNGYADNLTIDRIDNDAGYGPLNCRWITHGQNFSRAVRGEKNWMTNLKENDVRHIRRLYSDGMTQAEICKKLDMHKATISKIVNRQSWRHI